MKEKVQELEQARRPAGLVPFSSAIVAMGQVVVGSVVVAVVVESTVPSAPCC